MELKVDPAVLKAYGYSVEDLEINQLGSGLINRTYLLAPFKTTKKYILQNINTDVFNNPPAIARNIKAVADYLAIKYPNYLFIKPVLTVEGEEMAHIGQEYWRMLPYISDTISLDSLTDPKQAYEAAKQFGKLSRLLNDFNPDILEPTIEGFHNLKLRYEQFLEALEHCTDALRLEQAKKEIENAVAHKYLLDFYISYAHRDDFPDRVMHHDTKISNVLLNKETFEGVCVIDLDTIMPGKFISDLGDMMRTYLCAYTENETDLSKVKIRLPYFEATIKGYLAEMKVILTGTEKELLLFSGKYIIYMQALRFLTDYLNNNVYYPVSYPEQNLDRAKNQFKLLFELTQNERTLQDIIEENLV